MAVRDRISIILPTLLAVVLASCGGEGSVTEITQTRRVDSLPMPPRPDATSAQRFGYERGMNASAPHGAAHSAEEMELPFTWATPEGWHPAPDRPMRVVTFTAGPAQEAECYVTILGAGGGGTVANINRWREQMGQPPLEEAAVSALPVLEVLGKPSPWVEVRGAFTSASGEAMDDALLLGLVCPADAFSVFVKMTGPATVVEAQRDAFLAFCTSLTWSPPADS
ncbi:MAG TPA: hypothetical protein PKW60_09200 [Candidatus Hydrogenedentes bacterium]|jgi:hypothetical protein|nr:hypothetical protein [Candidatus Hydrogenedentota bacterium]